MKRFSKFSKLRSAKQMLIDIVSDQLDITDKRQHESISAKI